MKVTLRAPIVLTFHSPLARETAFLLVASLRAALISSFVFVGYVYPLYYLQWLRGPLQLAAKILGIPIYLLGKVVPPLASPVLDGHAEFAEVWQLFWAHMIPGALAYVLLFHFPSLVRFLRSRSAGGTSAPA